MCGILLWRTAGLDAQQIAQVRDLSGSLRHRGPDASACVQDGDWLFGFHRLAIVGLGPGGDQPFVRHGATLVCNGQVYNYRQLCEAYGVASPRSDVDVLIDVLQSSDLVAALDAVDGDFAVAAKTATGVIVARDPVGVRPLFYAVGPDGAPIAFASEAKALLGGPGVACVERFPPGHYWRPGNGFRRYTSIYNPSNRFMSQSRETAVAAVKVLLREAIRKRVVHTERPLAFLCSGGIDSCIVVAVAHEILTQLGAADSMHVFSMRYDDRSSQSEDAMYADMFLSNLGVSHTAVSFCKAEIAQHYQEVVRVCESHDPNTIRAALPMYLLASHIAKKTDYKVLLSGEVSDELFLGYDYCRQAPCAEAANDESARLVQNIHSFDVLRADRCFAAHGLEIRVPFADRDLLKYMFYTDASLRMFRNGEEKALLRDAFADCPALQHVNVLRRPKQRCSDGVGYSYVPSVFEYACRQQGVQTSVLAEKEQAELSTARAIFSQHYPGAEGLIITRTMPSWCKRGSTQLLAA